MKTTMPVNNNDPRAATAPMGQPMGPGSRTLPNGENPMAAAGAKKK